MRLKYPDQEYSANNPYVFATWDEFAEIDSIPNIANYVYFEGDTTGIYEDETKRVIDLNDSHPEGFEYTIYFKANNQKILRLDGKGWTIRNFVSFADYAFYFKELNNDTSVIKNLNFLNCYHNTVLNRYNNGIFFMQSWNSYSGGPHYGLQLINCKFSLLINAINGSYQGVFYGRNTFQTKTNLCSFNIKFFNEISPNTKIFNGVYLANCNIKIKGMRNNFYNGGSQIFGENTFVNCKFYLDLKNNSSEGKWTLFDTSNTYGRGTFNNCYIDGNYKSSSSATLGIYAGGINNISIINNTHLQNIDTNNFTLLTNEQCISEEYLDSIGFPVIIEGD